MLSFASHLQSLTQPGNDTSDPIDLTDQDVQQWIRHSDDLPAVREAPSVTIDDEPLTPGTSVLELPWTTGIPEARTDNTVDPVDSLYSRLASDPHLSLLLPNLASLLSSTKKDDEISEELALMLGFDAIELVMEVLSNRLPLSYKLAIVDDSAPVTSEKAKSRPGKAAPQSGRITKGESRHQRAANGGVDFTVDDAKRRMEASFREAASRPLVTGSAPQAPEVLPHVYTSSSIVQNNVLSTFGKEYLLPLGTAREDREDCEEVIIPPAKPVPPRSSERLIPVTELDGLARGSFPGYTSLNRIQSIVYPTAYGTNENLLICAPTGAGKTDVAMLTVLRVIDQNISSPNAKSTPGSLAAAIKRNDFKIIYVAPMKALAAEIVRKLGKRLAWLSIRVRELTGDMQLTKSEIAETQIIVTTPEKWDVVTRKPTGEGELASKVKLLIIDEVHLLNEERGAVIETIVARTLRQVESTQSLIRVVGLSATLPNYVDVAEFLRVSKYQGLFYFDSSFRPIPLEQHFLGIKGKANSQVARRNLDRVTYQKVMDLVQQGHQVMVFVHARKETVKSAQALREAALADGTLDGFSSQDHPSFSLFRRDIGTSRNKEMKELFNDGFGIHHAGMLRSDRNMMERMFEARVIKVLCCTATLAWGVNLPAHAVIIKGTQVYDSSRGAFVDLSVLDVLQIFGRAGRPGMESSGEGYICTSEDKLKHYLNAVTAQHPIESKFIEGMVDSLNAEVSLGTVANIEDAIQWVGYTYLFVRMHRNPMVYGMTHEEPVDDPRLRNKRHQLVTTAARKLADARMVTFNESTGSLVITDLGRIAAKYYIRAQSMEIFNQKLQPRMSEADVLGLLSMSTEFDQIQLRENEVKELKCLEEVIPCDVKDGTDTSQGKVNILLQGYISRTHIEDFALVSDMAYVAQNGGRIIRGLLEIAISRKWANVCSVLMSMSKAVEKRMWPFEHPLTQFDLSSQLLYNLQRWADNLLVPEVASHSAADLGQLIHMNEQQGAALLKAAKYFPTVVLTYRLRPLSSDLLRISIDVSKNFDWNPRLHGEVEPFWLWIEDHEGIDIIQWFHLLLRQNTSDLEVDFVIPIRGSKPPPSVNIRFMSDRWMGAEDEVNISLEGLIMPTFADCHTPLLDLPFLPTTGGKAVSSPLYKLHFRDFNGIQTQCFWSLVQTNQNLLICAPAGSGKSTLAMLGLCQKVGSNKSDAFGLVIVPNRSSAKETASLFKASQGPSRISVDTIFAPDALLAIRGKGIRITTSSCLLAALRRDVTNSWLSDLKIVLCDSLELLDAEYELAVSLLVSLTQRLPVRFIGLSNCLNDPTDLAQWLHVRPRGLFSFRSSDREQSLTMKTVTFTTRHSAALFEAMTKPAYMAIREADKEASAMLFVPSRAQCQSVAEHLITQCAIDIDTRAFLGLGASSSEEVEAHLFRLRNNSLSNLISRGIGIFHEGVDRADRALMLQLYLEGIIRVLIVPREACWTVPVHASVVIVMGTQFVRFGSESDRQLREYSIQEVAKMQACAVRPGHPGAFHLYCQAEQHDTYTRFLDEGLPLESGLKDSEVLKVWLQDMRKAGAVTSKQDCVDALSFTYLARRVETNPVYYDASPGNREHHISRYVDTLWEE